MPSEGPARPAARFFAAVAAALGAAHARLRSVSARRAGDVWRDAAAAAVDPFAARLLRLAPERAAPAGAEPTLVALPAASPAPPGPLPAALAASVLPALGRASEAAAYLRLAPPGSAAASPDLARLEAALEELRRRVGAMASSGGPGAEGPVDLVRVVEETLAGLPAGARGPRVRRVLRRVIAFAEPRRVRLALREALGAFAAAAPPGGELRVTVEPRGGEAVFEVAGGLAGQDDGAPALVRVVLGPRGGRVEEEVGASRGRTLRVAFPLATSV